jgi:hypothetical protein
MLLVAGFVCVVFQEFSTAGLGEVCARSRFAILNEHPDSASSNVRKTAMSAASAPKNCLYIGGKCDAHQGHRVVELREHEVIGDIYAIAASASNPELQNKLQVGLQSIIKRELMFLRGATFLWIRGGIPYLSAIVVEGRLHERC